jgi:signal peptidase I
MKTFQAIEVTTDGIFYWPDRPKEPVIDEAKQAYDIWYERDSNKMKFEYTEALKTAIRYPVKNTEEEIRRITGVPADVVELFEGIGYRLIPGIYPYDGEVEIVDVVMDIYSKKGTKVYATDRNGYGSDKDHIKNYLTVGGLYTVEKVDVGQSSSRVYFQEKPNQSFNTVCFVEKFAILVEPPANVSNNSSSSEPNDTQIISLTDKINSQYYNKILKRGSNAESATFLDVLSILLSNVENSQTMNMQNAAEELLKNFNITRK